MASNFLPFIASTELASLLSKEPNWDKKRVFVDFHSRQSGGYSIIEEILKVLSSFALNENEVAEISLIQ